MNRMRRAKIEKGGAKGEAGKGDVQGGKTDFQTSVNAPHKFMHCDFGNQFNEATSSTRRRAAAPTRSSFTIG